MSFEINFRKFSFSFTSRKLGKLKFRVVTLGNLVSLEEDLKKIKNDREFLYRSLHRQLYSPEVDYSKFREISEEEIKSIARKLVKKEDGIFRHFKETSDGDFFQEFRSAVAKYREEELKKLQESFEPIRRTLENFSNNYSDFLERTIFPKEAIDKFARFTKSLSAAQLSITESMAPVFEQMQNTALQFEKILKPQIDTWQKWVIENQRIFDNVRDFWKTFQEQYKINEKEAIEILRKYKWFVSPSLPIAFVSEVVRIGRKRGNRRKEVNGLFVSFFCFDDYKELDKLVNGWVKHDLFKPRMKILMDCVNGLRNSRGGVNPSNFVLPALIAQIDGIQQEYMEKHGCVKKGRWKDSSGKEIDWKDFYRNMTPNQDLDELANEIFLNILFQGSQRGKPLETPFTFNRHKIMHGEYVKYGRIDNTIRAFLILDFLAFLK